jgi:transcriptional regulator with XRE-family HTH domain
MSYGLHWSEEFIRQLSDKEVRDEFVADQIRARIALLIRALRDQKERGWTQTELGKRAGKPQNVISRIEDPDYGKLSLQTLLEVAAAFDLPVWIDIPEWGDWFQKIKDVPNSQTARASFNQQRLLERRAPRSQAAEAFERMLVQEPNYGASAAAAATNQNNPQESLLAVGAG